MLMYPNTHYLPPPRYTPFEDGCIRNGVVTFVFRFVSCAAFPHDCVNAYSMVASGIMAVGLSGFAARRSCSKWMAPYQCHRQLRAAYQAHAQATQCTHAYLLMQIWYPFDGTNGAWSFVGSTTLLGGDVLRLTPAQSGQKGMLPYADRHCTSNSATRGYIMWRFSCNSWLALQVAFGLKICSTLPTGSLHST
jgi:hypothetical protein